MRRAEYYGSLTGKVERLSEMSCAPPQPPVCKVQKMSKQNETSVDCEIRAVIRFLNARGTTAVEIHRQICDIYGEGAIRDSMVRRWAPFQ